MFLPLAPEHTRKQLLLHAAHQFVDGTTYHWWHPLTEEGLQKPFNDDLLWLPFVTLNYLRETAEFAVLDERVPFLGEDKKPSRDTGTLYEHCRRAIDSFWGRLSERGVPLMGAGDWNDGLSAIGAKLNAGGASQFPVAGDPTISVKGQVTQPGTVRTYQMWYRNSDNFCSAETSNFSNGVEVRWEQ